MSKNRILYKKKSPHAVCELLSIFNFQFSISQTLLGDGGFRHFFLSEGCRNENLFYFCAGGGVDAAVAFDEQYAVAKHLCTLYIVSLYIAYALSSTEADEMRTIR